MIKPEAREQIKGFLEGFIQGMIREHKKSALKPFELRPVKNKSIKGDIKPFHQALLPEGILRITEFERSFSTKLGTTFEECARLVANGRFGSVKRGHVITGKISLAAIREIENIVNKIGTYGLQESYPNIVNRIVLASLSGKMLERSKIADIYLLDKNGTEMFFEMKSPKPNKGQCLEAIDRLLQIHAIKKLDSPKVKTFYAMAYNPYGNLKSDYNHSFAKRYMDVQNQVLIGKEFWNLIGGNGTYEEILDIYREVGREKGHDMLDQLALNY